MENTYNIPVESRTQQEYFDFVSSLPIVFDGERSISVVPSSGTVKVAGTITGYTPITE